MKRLKSSILWSLLILSAAVAEAAQKPNFIVILADDLGYGDFACFEGEEVKTPNIDSLARDGMKLTSFYVHQRCSPARLAFMTGSYPVDAVAHRLQTILDTKFDGKTVMNHSLDFCFEAMKLSDLIK